MLHLMSLSPRRRFPMTMFLALGLAGSVLCLVSSVYLLVDDSSDYRDEYEGF